MDTKQSKPSHRRYRDIIDGIRNNIIKLPKFQRDFVWSMNQTAKLLDSILRGYPIGTFIIWKTKTRLAHIKSIGNLNLSDPPDDHVEYVLDGQQRITSLFVAAEGITISKDGKDYDYKNIYVDLTKSDNEENIVSTERPSKDCVTIYDLLHQGHKFFTKFDEKFYDKIDQYTEIIKTYEFAVIEIDDYPIDVAVDIFNRINTSGNPLSLFEIMVAKTYDENTDFDLAEKYKILQGELDEISYQIPDAQLLQCISMNLTKECTRKTILELQKEDIVKIYDDTIISIKQAIEHFRNSYRIPASQILPYPALIVPFSYFFFKNEQNPTQNQDKHLQEYFWRSALTSRFSSSVESKLAKDRKIIEDIMNDKKPTFDLEFKVTINKDEIKERGCKVNDSINKSILCILAYFKPKSFNSNIDVKLDNDWLLRINSKNYHHFFPKAFLKKRGFDDLKSNSIANITLVDDYLNKNKIKARAPSDYMKEFEKSNDRLQETMQTHLIDDLDEFGIWTDDFEAFLEKRSTKIWEELKKRFNS